MQKNNVLATSKTKDVFLTRKQYILYTLEHVICRESVLKSPILRVVNIIFPTILEKSGKIGRQMKI